MSLWAFVASVVLVIAGYLLLSGFAATYRKFRGARVITCPENLEPAAVQVNALRAAHWAAVSGEPDLRLKACSRWPEMAGCGQECLKQVESAPESCLARTMVASWYAGRHCYHCKRDIGPIVWHEQPPALRAPDGTSVEWKDVPPENLPRVFATHDAVCWNCHITEGFRHDHPEMVVQRQVPHPHEERLRASSNVY